MSETDSFIEEVTEEVRRDRLYGYMRRYGWIAIVAVVLLVGGAAYNEYTKAQHRAETQTRGDAILDALGQASGPERAAALDTITDAGPAAPVVDMLRSAEALASEDVDAAAAALQKIIDDAELPQTYRDLAALKQAIITADATEPDARIAALSGLTTPGSVFRVLAEEQIALAEIDKGDTAAAISRLTALLEDNEATQDLRTRAQQMIVALGGDVDPG